MNSHFSREAAYYFLTTQLNDRRIVRGFLLNFVVNPAFKLAVGRLPESAAAPCSQPTMSYGPEFASKELDLWAFMRDVTLDFSRPGKPTDNAFAEFFNAKFRAECLNASWFLSLDEARRSCEAWRRGYNHASTTPIGLCR